MKRHVAAITGLSGVGKSTLLRKLASTVSFQCLQASALIQEARQSDQRSLTPDQLRSLDLDENQKHLISGFTRAARQGSGLIVLDAHTVIEQDGHVVPIGPDVFGAIGINSMIFLTEDSAELVKRRLSDRGRQRPINSPEQLRHIQDQAIRHAKEICRVLAIPISVVSPNDLGAITDLLRSYVSPHK